MKKKILAIAIMTIFLLAGMTTLSAVGMKASEKINNILNNDDVETIDEKVIICGSVFIRGDGTAAGSIVDVNAEGDQEIEIDGLTNAIFKVEVDAQFLGFPEDWADAIFILGRFSGDVLSLKSESQLKTFDPKTRITEPLNISRYVSPGDMFVYTIKAGYVFREYPVLKKDSDIGKGFFPKSKALDINNLIFKTKIFQNTNPISHAIIKSFPISFVSSKPVTNPFLPLKPVLNQITDPQGIQTTPLIFEKSGLLNI